MDMTSCNQKSENFLKLETSKRVSFGLHSQKQKGNFRETLCYNTSGTPGKTKIIISSVSDPDSGAFWIRILNPYPQRLKKDQKC